MVPMTPLSLSIRLASPGHDNAPARWVAPGPATRARAANDNPDCFEQRAFDRAVVRELVSDEMPE